MLLRCRYRRLVDSIYPRAITDGLISSNMQKLIFYAISHPEKLERIGEYLVLRMSRDLGRMRLIQVKVFSKDDPVASEDSMGYCRVEKRSRQDVVMARKPVWSTYTPECGPKK
ncbi:unnamed protein product [Haemonchus placei]|uniref:HORMA domain-containing protein n=1 Tax=Haemonchus placei TaxID=6290 RepID=A0A0N4XBM9_HAEPC|nr:unnamed protein product [Haemonchus placei]